MSSEREPTRTVSHGWRRRERSAGPSSGRRASPSPCDLTTPPLVARVEDTADEWNSEIRSCRCGCPGGGGRRHRRYFSRPAVVPATSPTPGQSPGYGRCSTQPAVVPPTNSPTTAPTVTTQPTHQSKAPWVVFLREAGGTGLHDLWAMRVDGSDAHEILPGLSVLANIAWSQDGSRLLVTDSDATGTSHVYMADVSDLIGPFVDTGFGTGADTACLEMSREPFPCRTGASALRRTGSKSCFSKHARMLAGLTLGQLSTNYISGCDFLTILDLRTGARTELSETLQQGRQVSITDIWAYRRGRPMAR